MVKNIKTVAGFAVAALFFGSAQAFAEEETPEPPVTDITINIAEMAPLEIQLTPDRLYVGVGNSSGPLGDPPFSRPQEGETAADGEVVVVEGVSAVRQGLSMAANIATGSGASTVSLRFGLDVRTDSFKNSKITGSFSGVEWTPEGSEEKTLLDGDTIGLLNDLSLSGRAGTRPNTDSTNLFAEVEGAGCGAPFTIGSTSTVLAPGDFVGCVGLKPGFDSIDGEDISPLIVLTSMTVADDGEAPTEPGTLAVSFTWIIEVADQSVD